MIVVPGVIECARLVSSGQRPDIAICGKTTLVEWKNQADQLTSTKIMGYCCISQNEIKIWGRLHRFGFSAGQSPPCDLRD